MTSTIKINALETGADTLNVGEAGQNVIIGADSIKNNALKDAGGNALFTSNGSGVLSSINSGFGSAMVLINTLNASSSAYLEFTSGIDSTYKAYQFKFYTLHPQTDQASFEWQVSSDGGSSYGMTITSTGFWGYNNDSNSGAFQYATQLQQAQATGYQRLGYLTGNENTKIMSGDLLLFNPASTTYIKNFMGLGVNYEHQDTMQNSFTAGYVNVASPAINAIRFKFSTGNIDAGKIKMYGIK